mgnify:CR=1 FL=1
MKNITVTPVNNTGLIVAMITGVVVWQIFVSAMTKTEPIDPARIPVIAAHKAAIEQCRNQTNCAGGFIQYRGVMPIYRVTEGQAGDGSWTVGTVWLIQSMEVNGDQFLDRVQDFVPPSDPRWDDFAKRYAKQFVHLKSEVK